MNETGDRRPTHHLPGLADAHLRCWERFLESSTLLLERLDRTLREAHNVALADFLVLDALARSANGSARMKDLARVAVLRPSRVTEQIGRLESQGLVRRIPSVDDGRSVITTLTRDGLATVRPVARTYTREIRKFYFDPLTRQQMISLGDACRRIGESLPDQMWSARPKSR